MLQMKTRSTSLFFIICLAVLVIFSGAAVYALTVGQVVSNVQIMDANNKPATIPLLGTKLISIFYNDADAADVNDPLADAIKAKKFPEAKYKGMGVANLADSKAPNFLIRRIIQGKIKKYNTTILTDPDRIIAKQWGLGDCNNTSVFILIGADKKVKYVKKGAIRGAEINTIIELIDKLIK